MYIQNNAVIFVHTITAFDALFYVLVNCSVMLLLNMELLFPITSKYYPDLTNNTSRDGGDVIYGINFYTCSVTHQSLGHRITGYSHILDGVHIHVDQLGNDSFSLLSYDPV